LEPGRLAIANAQERIAREQARLESRRTGTAQRRPVGLFCSTIGIGSTIGLAILFAMLIIVANHFSLASLISLMWQAVHALVGPTADQGWRI
jgi:hypothetical protein